MTPTLPPMESAAAKTRAAYHAAADTYDHPALSFWDHFGRATVARLNLPSGGDVLDVCCGSGASALAAAQHVGPRGRVLGIDLAPGLIGLARAKAGRAALMNATFREADFDTMDERDETYDAVVCVFGIFFMRDMAAAAERLWRWVRPGGQLAITTWGPRLFEPANSFFWDAIQRVRPELHKAFNPWDRISTPVALLGLMEDAGISGATAAPETRVHALHSAEDWWSIVMGSGYRGTIERLTPHERAHVRAVVTGAMHQFGINCIETNVIYGLARKA